MKRVTNPSIKLYLYKFWMALSSSEKVVDEMAAISMLLHVASRTTLGGFPQVLPCGGQRDLALRGAPSWLPSGDPDIISVECYKAGEAGPVHRCIRGTVIVVCAGAVGPRGQSPPRGGPFPSTSAHFLLQQHASLHRCNSRYCQWFRRQQLVTLCGRLIFYEQLCFHSVMEPVLRAKRWFHQKSQLWPPGIGKCGDKSVFLSKASSQELSFFQSMYLLKLRLCVIFFFKT